MKFKKAQPKSKLQTTPIAERIINIKDMDHIRIALYCNPPTNQHPYAVETQITHTKATGGWETDTAELRNYPTLLRNIRYKLPTMWQKVSGEWYDNAFRTAEDWEVTNHSAFPTLHAKMGARIGSAGNQRYHNIPGVLASVHCSSQPRVLLQIADIDDSGLFHNGICEEFELTNKRQFKPGYNLWWENFECQN